MALQETGRFKEAFDVFCDLADSGSVAGKFQKATYLYDGNNVEKDQKTAIALMDEVMTIAKEEGLTDLYRSSAECLGRDFAWATHPLVDSKLSISTENDRWKPVVCIFLVLFFIKNDKCYLCRPFSPYLYHFKRGIHFISFLKTTKTLKRIGFKQQMKVTGLLLPWLTSENIILQMNIIKMHFIGINVLPAVEMLIHKLASVRFF